MKKNENVESEKGGLKLDLSRIEYVAQIPKGILRYSPLKKPKPPVENTLNGEIYPSDAFTPEYWDERIMPSEYNKEMCIK